ncbi:MAG: LapA family protein [Sulfurimicrobium sp.]|nr:LapA family protein [Sulfurimicrobium sp.]MDP1896345.1 LapA family protein [Sulfurimicrobium sp.]MDP2197058.1 LapA family protein [Sulfurimicrobium sp.]MDP3688374.1 LapA family protein [Sulfurimicrobium sp.]
MQLILIFGITIAIGAVMFALQNNVPVTVNFALWRFDSSLAMVLLLALGLGVIIAALLSSPTMLRKQWTASRLRRQVAGLEEDKAALAQRVKQLELEIARISPTPVAKPEEPKPYVGLKTLLTGGSSGKPEGE